MTAIFSALGRLDRAIDRNREIKKVRPIEKSGDKTDMKDKGHNGDRRWDESDLDYLLRMHEKNKDTTS